MSFINGPSNRNKVSNAQKMREQRLLNKFFKRFYCEECNIAYGEEANLENHLKGTKHDKGYVIYVCLKCDFKTKDKLKYKIHKKTQIHIK